MSDSAAASSPPSSSDTSGDQTAELHRSQGITANNATWDWLGKPDGERTTDDEEAMTRSAYAAAYHWSRAGHLKAIRNEEAKKAQAAKEIAKWCKPDAPWYRRVPTPDQKTVKIVLGGTLIVGAAIGGFFSGLVGA